MPFTLAHPLGALPLKWVNRSLFSTTGLIVGSMAPDYEYFLKQYPSPTIGETTLGIIFFDFPMAIVVALTFHLLVKRALILHLPEPYGFRYSGYAASSFLSYLGRHWLIFLVSVCLGIASHLLLDWITQPIHGPFAKTDFTAVISIGSFRTRPSIVAERIFDVAGTLILVLIVLKLRNPAPDYVVTSAKNKWTFWAMFMAVTLTILIWEWYEAGGISSTAVFVTVLIWAVAVGLITASVLTKLVERFQPGR